MKPMSTHVSTKRLIQNFSAGFPDAQIWLDEKGTILYQNRKAQGLTGHPEEPGGKPASISVVGNWNIRLEQIVEKTIKKGKWQGEIRITCNKNHPKIYRILCYRIKEIFPQSVIMLTATDITRNVLEKEELRLLSVASRETFNSIIFTDASRKILWVNPAFTKNTGYTLEDVRGKVPGHILQGPETDTQVIQWMGAKLSAEEEFECEVKNHTKSGELIWMKIHVQPVFDANKKVKNFLGIATNITDQKKLEEAIEKQRKTEERKLIRATLKGQEKERDSLGRELHDNINQLLAAGSLYLDMVPGHNHPEKIAGLAKEMLGKAITEIRQLSHKLVTPALPNNHGIGKAIAELAKGVETTSGIMVEIDLHCLDTINWEEENKLHLYRIVQEQFSNIIKYASASRINLGCHWQQSVLTITIRDNGKGFDPDIQGSGIGLSNIHNRAILMGGEARITSTPGGGCKVEISFPAKKSDAQQQTNSKPF
ncbi:MAG: PAS domain S-box protein [Bacteroidetes bacterium]|nr:PAS domain S-box protein [Bacteroidota bacterium]